MTAPLIELRDLAVEFVAHDRRISALDGVSLTVGRGEVLGLVGETGCGKTLTGLAMLGLLPGAARVTRGSVLLEGADLAASSAAELRRVRGARIAMIFQNPRTAFNPVFSIGAQIEFVLSAHEKLPRGDRTERIRAALVQVGLPDANRIMRAYPHQVSGGMLQRAMIAMALICRPALVVADEPTTALDVTIAAQILRLLRSLQQEHGFSVVFITHDLGVVRRISDRVAVLYAGRVVEEGRTDDLFRSPQHPYSRGLIAAVPRSGSRGKMLASIPGAPPRDAAAYPGCPFVPRCPIAIDRCGTDRPALLPTSNGQVAACHLAARA